MKKLNHLMWPGLPIALIVSIIAVHVVMLVVASSDPSFAVDATYRNGDGLERIAQQRDSRKLGWAANVTLEQITPSTSMVTVLLTDAHGNPIDDASARIRIFHKSRAGDALTLECLHTEGGRYVVPMKRTRSGQWEYRLMVERGGEQFQVTDTVRLTELAKEPAP